MFRMSREELIARLETATRMDYSKLNATSPVNLKLLLYVPGGMIACSSANLPTRDDVIVQEGNSMHFAPLDLILSVDCPLEIPSEAEKELFLYCKDAVIIPFSGKEIRAESLVVPLSAVTGFSLGSLK